MTFDVTPAPIGWIAPAKPTILDVHSFPGFEAKLIHLLLGSINVVHTPTGAVTVQRTNWAVLGSVSASRSKAAMQAALNAQTLGTPELDAYLTRNLAQLGFFEELFDEFARYFHHTKRGAHVQAFLHIYRILERVSYSFPMAYAAKSNDYKGTFSLLRNYLTDVKDGELKFFSGFIATLISQATSTSLVKLDVSSNDPSTRTHHFQTLKSSISHKKIVSESAGMWVEIRYSDLLSVLISLRNRYFHFMSGPKDNLTGKNLPDPDEFFESINPTFVNWLSYIYFRVLEARL